LNFEASCSSSFPRKDKWACHPDHHPDRFIHPWKFLSHHKYRIHPKFSHFASVHPDQKNVLLKATSPEKAHLFDFLPGQELKFI